MIKEIYSENRIFLNLFVGLASFMAIILGTMGRDAAFLWVNAHYSTVADYIFFGITHLGDGATYILTAIVLAYLYNRKTGFIALMSYAITGITAQLLKKQVFNGVLRPHKYFEEIYDLKIHSISWVTMHDYNSFPSGHTTTAFSIAILLCMVVKKPHLQLLWLTLAALVGFSRMYLGQHFLSDVLAGSILGTLLTIVVYYTFNKMSFLEKKWWQLKLLQKS